MEIPIAPLTADQIIAINDAKLRENCVNVALDNAPTGAETPVVLKLADVYFQYVKNGTVPTA